MSTDVLERLLITLAVRIHAFAICEIQQGWRLAMPPMEAVIIHFVLQGKGTVTVDGHEPIEFSPNCLVVIPARKGQTLGFPEPCVGVAEAAAHTALVKDGLVRFRAGNGGRDILCVCGTIAATYGGALGLFDFLPRPIVQDMAAVANVRHAFEMMVEEMTSPSLGTQAMTETLMKQCLLELLRRHLRELNVESPFFASLQDQRLARAVASIVEEPAAPHSVESLAAAVGMSRSAFADRFSAVFQQGPIEFLQRVRLRVGAHLLSTTDLPLKVIAANVGYASRSHFTRVFKQIYGADPTTYRRFGGADEQEAKPVEVIGVSGIENEETSGQNSG